MEEGERCANYLDAGTSRSITSAVEANLVERHIAGVLDKGFEQMVAGYRLDDLSRLHGLMARVSRLAGFLHSHPQKKKK